MDNQKVMTFSFQNPKLKKLEYFHSELAQLQEMSKQCRSKSSTDMHSVNTTTADSKNYQTINVNDEVSAFNKKADPFLSSLQKIQMNQNKCTQTEPSTKLESIQDQVNHLQHQKDAILNQVQIVRRENLNLINQNKMLENENAQLKCKLSEVGNEWPEKEKFYQQTLQQYNWQIMKMSNEQQNSLTSQFTTQEQDQINIILKEILQLKQQDRLNAIQQLSESQDLKEEIMQLKRQHIDKVRDLMEKIKQLQAQNEQISIIEPELLSTQESIQLVTNVLHRAIKSNDMMGQIRSNQRLVSLIEDIANRNRFKLDQTHVRTFSLHKVDLNSTNKKFSSRKLV